jgi:hypothetical protein
MPDRRAMQKEAEKLEYIAMLAKELAKMSDKLDRPVLSYLLRMAVLEAEGGVVDPSRPAGNGARSH